MELRVTELQEIKPIDFNYKETKEWLETQLVKYKTTVYEEENIKSAKEDRATLNKLSKAINDKKIELKKQVLKPFEDFETKAKELIGIIGEATGNIDVQIKNIEEKRKQEKQVEIEKIYKENIGDLTVLKLESISNDKWLNSTYKITEIEKEIIEAIENTKNDLQIIEELKSEFELQLKDLYTKKLSLSDVLRENTRLIEQKKAFEELKTKQEVEKKNIIQEQKVEENQAIFNKATIEELQQIDFRIWVTNEQKQVLRKFLIDSSIQYAPVPKNETEVEIKKENKEFEKKYKVTVDTDYVTGHLRYGHLEKNMNKEEYRDFKKEVLDTKKYELVRDFDFDLIIDDYEIDDYEINNNIEVKIKESEAK